MRGQDEQLLLKQLLVHWQSADGRDIDSITNPTRCRHSGT